MIYVEIVFAKDKHDCFITNSDGEILFKAFTIQNNWVGFDELDITTTTYSVISLIKVSRPTLSIRFTQIFTEKVSALERRKRIRLIPEPLL